MTAYNDEYGWGFSGSRKPLPGPCRICYHIGKHKCSIHATEEELEAQRVKEKACDHRNSVSAYGNYYCPGCH